MTLTLKKYHISFIITEYGNLQSYLGSPIEGSFGRALEAVNSKLYNQLNNVKINQKNKAYRYTRDNTPRPYMIFPTLNGGKKKPGDKLSFELTLFGKYSNKFKYLVPVFRQMGKTGFGGKFLKAEFVGVEELLSPISFSTEFNLDDYLDLGHSKQMIKIKFISPVSFRSQQKMDTDFGFNEFYKRLYLRTFILNHIYGDKLMPDIEHFDFDVNLVETHHHRLDKIFHKGQGKEAYSLKASELLLKYKADIDIIDEIYPLLKFGELISVGSNTVYGFGKYIIDP
ncbi:MAG: CRISPR system precrRNA processing endoribonuclease RAMP protein Cas6 [Deltaproteobacteria bacterium]